MPDLTLGQSLADPMTAVPPGWYTRQIARWSLSDEGWWVLGFVATCLIPDAPPYGHDWSVSDGRTDVVSTSGHCDTLAEAVAAAEAEMRARGAL